MDFTERENYFSIYMRNKTNSTRKKKTIDLIKNLKLIPNHYTHKNKTLHSILFNTSSREKNSLSFLKKCTIFLLISLAFNKEKDTNDKIDRLESKISNMINLIENFEQIYLYNEGTKIKKEFQKIGKLKQSKHKDKLSFSASYTGLTNDTNNTNQTITQTKPLSSNSINRNSDKVNMNIKTLQKKNSRFKYCIDNRKKALNYSIKPKIKTNGYYIYNKKRKKNNKNHFNKFVYSKKFGIKFNNTKNYYNGNGKNDLDAIGLRANVEFVRKQSNGNKIKEIEIKNYKKLIIKPKEGLLYKCKSDRE